MAVALVLAGAWPAWAQARRRRRVTRLEGFLHFAETLHSRPGSVLYKVDEKLAAFDRAIAARAPDDLPGKVSKAYSLRGSLWSAKGDCERAVADFSEALRADPEGHHAGELTTDDRYERALCLWKLGRKDAALDDLTASVGRRTFQVSFSYLQRGRLLRELGRYAEAILDFTQAAATVDRSAEGNAGFQARRRKQLVEMSRKNVALATYERAVARRLAGDGEGAGQDLEEALRLDPSCWNAFAERSYLRTSQGRHAEAVADLTKAIEGHNGAWPPWLRQRANAHEALGDPAAAARDRRAADEAERRAAPAPRPGAAPPAVSPKPG